MTSRRGDKIYHKIVLKKKNKETMISEKEKQNLY